MKTREWKPKGKTNGRAGRPSIVAEKSHAAAGRRQPKKAKGHEGVGRVAALRNRTGEHSLGKQAAEVTIEAAMATAVEQLGVEVTSDGDTAIQQMQALAVLGEAVKEAKTEFETKADSAKVAKKTLDSKQRLLAEALWRFTHPPAPMPLLDAAEAQAGRDALVAPLLDIDDFPRQTVSRMARAIRT